MECPGDIAWLCLSFPLLLPAFVAMVQAGATSVDVDHLHWKTDYGPVEIAAISETVAGRYPQLGGVLVMRRPGPDRYEGVWIQKESERPCSGPPDLTDTPHELLAMSGVAADSRHWGRVRFDLDGQSGRVAGAWSYCSDEIGTGGAWNGTVDARGVRSLRVPPR